MRKITMTALAAVSFAWVGAAHAIPITGSLAFSDGANETGQSLLLRTSFSVTNATTQPSPTDNFSTVPLNTAVTISTFTIPNGLVPTAVVSPSNFSASFSGGTFAASSVQKTDQSVAPITGNESITVLFQGVFTPAGSLSAFDPSPASVIANLNRSGTGSSASVSSAFTLASPPASTPPVTPVPEPASMMLLGMGLVGIGVLRRLAK